MWQDVLIAALAYKDLRTGTMSETIL
jgi:hypothetical protein